MLIEESILGWKEYEMEVMRDKDDNVVIICSIENFDPMGIHTGDSITVAPAQTLTDKEYQRMRDASLAVIREIGVETGGSNIQFAIHPKTGRMIVIEMNPRVSRSSALASKATGFPIAKIAAKLAVGYRLHELPNDITRETTACFEPTIDYVVTKVPRFAFEKFPDADATLTTQMKSVGETMAIGSTFKESFQKALRGLEVRSDGFGCDRLDLWGTPEQPTRIEIISETDEAGCRASVVSALRVQKRHERRQGPRAHRHRPLVPRQPARDPRNGRSRCGKSRRAAACGESRPVERICSAPPSAKVSPTPARPHLRRPAKSEVRAERLRHGIRTTFKSVDTCAAEFEAYTPYYYSTYEAEDEVPPKPPGKKRIMILGGGPNRIGQGIEFDYCCCHASFALRELGIESIMVNSNPETVSTDYDTSDMLFFEPLTVEDVLNICDRVQPDGVIVQFGGQTPLNLARRLADAGVPIIGTSVDAIEAAEDREKFQQLLHKLNLRQPPNGIARTMDEARREAEKIGYPLLRAAELRARRPGDGNLLRRRPARALRRRGVHRRRRAAGADRSLSRRGDGGRRRLHQRRHDGHRARHHGAHRRGGRSLGRLGLRDSAVQLARPGDRRDSRGDGRAGPRAQRDWADERAVRGPLGARRPARNRAGWSRRPVPDLQPPLPNLFPVVYVLEVNPRASRTVPFVAKATGMPVAKIAAKVMAGVSLAEQGVTEDPVPSHVSVKEAVFPFIKFWGVDIVLGPEMRIDRRSDGHQRAVQHGLRQEPARGRHGAAAAKATIFLSVAERHKPAAVELARRLSDMGFSILATTGTAAALEAAGIPLPADQENPRRPSQSARLLRRRARWRS